AEDGIRDRNVTGVQTCALPICKKGPAVPELWLSADDIATHLGVSKDTVYAWIADRDKPAHKIGRLWKFQASEVDDWVRRGGASRSEERRVGKKVGDGGSSNAIE